MASILALSPLMIRMSNGSQATLVVAVNITPAADNLTVEILAVGITRGRPVAAKATGKRRGQSPTNPGSVQTHSKLIKRRKLKALDEWRRTIEDVQTDVDRRRSATNPSRGWLTGWMAVTHSKPL